MWSRILIVLAIALTGCATPKQLRKSWDEGYAQGYQEGQYLFKKEAEKAYSTAKMAYNQCMNRLNQCLEADKEK